MAVHRILYACISGQIALVHIYLIARSLIGPELIDQVRPLAIEVSPKCAANRPTGALVLMREYITEATGQKNTLHGPLLFFSGLIS